MLHEPAGEAHRSSIIPGQGAGPEAARPATPEGSTLGLSLLDYGRSALIPISGELDITTSPLLQAVIDDVLRSRRTPRLARLVLDMSGVTFADAAGVSPVLHARAVLARRGGVVELRTPSRPVRRLLRLLDLPDLLTAARPPAHTEVLQGR